MSSRAQWGAGNQLPDLRPHLRCWPPPCAILGLALGFPGVQADEAGCSLPQPWQPHLRGVVIQEDTPIQYPGDGIGQGPLCPLDINHSHLILVETGTPGKGDAALELRLQLEKYISKQRVPYGGEGCCNCGVPSTGCEGVSHAGRTMRCHQRAGSSGQSYCRACQSMGVRTRLQGVPKIVSPLARSRDAFGVRRPQTGIGVMPPTASRVPDWR